MPAVTVEDLLVLPRLEAVDARRVSERPVRTVTVAPHGLEGEGFPGPARLRRGSAVRARPFVHMDQMGEVEYAPGEAKGTPWHPHRGFETVTYMIDGTFRHRDSHGGGGLITNGDTQWMTAGAGILHIEAPPEELVAAGGLFHGIQLWVNLPSADKWIPPKYQDIGRGNVALVTSPDAGALVRIIAGERRWLPGTGRDAHADQPRARHDRTRGDAPASLAAAVTTPSSTCCPGGGPSRALAGRSRQGSSPCSVVATTSRSRRTGTRTRSTPELDVLVLGGAPIGEPVAWYGPFVMNTDAEISQAFEDYRHGRMGEIPADDAGG